MGFAALTARQDFAHRVLAKNSPGKRSKPERARSAAPHRCSDWGAGAWGSSGLCSAPSPAFPPWEPEDSAERGTLMKLEPLFQIKGSRCPCFAREAWVACCSDRNGKALTFRGCCQSRVQMASPEPRAALHGKCAAQPAGSLRERAARGCRGRPGRGAQKRKACSGHNGAPAAAPRKTARSSETARAAPGRPPRSSCLFRTRPSKRAHLILNPLRRAPCEQGEGWPYNPEQSEAWKGLGTALREAALPPRMQMS